MRLQSTTSIAVEQSQRPFECPCGKNYKSYSALWVHIRNKHNGQAPGPIRKSIPALRPLKASLVSTTPQPSPVTTHLISATLITGQALQQQCPSTWPTSKEAMERLQRRVRALPEQSIPRRQMSGLGALTELNVLLTRGGVCLNKTVGSIMVECLGRVVGQVSWERFEQFTSLLVIFLEFIGRRRGDSRLLGQKKMDLLCEYANSFIQEGYELLAGEVGLSGCAVFEKHTMIGLLQSFFQWLMARQYISYKVTLHADYATLSSTS